VTPVPETRSDGRPMNWRAAVASSLKLLTGLRQKRVQGFVDGVPQGEWVVGWAWDPRRPARRLEIAILDGADFIGSGIADQPRKDLIAAGIGDGRYAFRIRLQARALDGRMREAQVCALTEYGRIPLQRGVIILNDERRVKQVASPVGKIGVLERVVGNVLHGWAYNPDQPDMPAALDIYDDERYLGSVTADRSRPRLREKGFPAGVRGFVFELAEPFEPGMATRLRARLIGGSHELKPASNFREVSGPRAGTEAAAETLAADKAGAPQAAAPGTETSGTAASQTLARPVFSASKLEAADFTVETPLSPAVVGLVIPAGQSAKLLPVAAAWGVQTHPHRSLATFAPREALPVPEPADLLWLGGAGKDAWRAFLARVEFVCFARGGEDIPPSFAGTLAALRGFPDIVVYAGSAETARLASFLLRPPVEGFAVRAQLLLRYPGDLPEELAQGFLHGLRVWLASETGLHWQSLNWSLALPPGKRETDKREAEKPVLPGDAVLRGFYERALAGKNWHVRLPAAEGAPLLWPRQGADSLSLGLWRGWERSGLPALTALLAEDFSGGIEILVPTGGREETGQVRLAAARALAAGKANVTCRLVDAPLEDSGGGDANICAALARAATGAALILAEAGVQPAPGTLAEILAWAMHPDTGAVGISPAGPDGSVFSGGALLLDRRRVGPAAGQAVAVDAVSPRFLAIATRKLVSVGGLDSGRFQGGSATLDLGLRLARYGYTSLLLGHLAAQAPSDWAAEENGALPWQVAALLASG
jgi:hypothetical protein